VSARETRAAMESFQRAVETGDVQGLLDVLAPDAVLVADGGGVKKAALRPIASADKVARFILGALRKNDLPVGITRTDVNGGPALLVELGDELDGVIAIHVEEGRIAGLYYVRNPAKLQRVRGAVPLTLRPPSIPAGAAATAVGDWEDEARATP
jgi:hypothetical protein